MTVIYQILLTLFLFGFLKNVTFGRRPFEIVLRSINCSANSKFVSETSCSLITHHNVPKVHLSIQISRIVEQFKFSFEVVAFKNNNNEYLKIFAANDIDGCMFMENKIDTQLLKIFHEICSSGGKFPTCPYSNETRFEFKGIFVDAEKFPPYMPEATFLLNVKSFVNKEKFFEIHIVTETVQRKKHSLLV